MVNLLTWLSRSQCQFVNSSQAAVLRRHRSARQLAVPKSQQIQTRQRKILAAPADINTDYVNLSLGHLRKTRDHVNEDPVIYAGVPSAFNVTATGVGGFMRRVTRIAVREWVKMEAPGEACGPPYRRGVPASARARPSPRR